MLHVAIKHASGMYAMDDGTSLYCKLGVERDAPRNSKECLTRKYKLKTDSSKVSRGMVTWGKEFDLAVAPHKKVLVIKVRKIGFSVMKLRRKIEVCLSSSRARARRGSHSPPSPSDPPPASCWHLLATRRALFAYLARTAVRSPFPPPRTSPHPILASPLRRV